MTTEWFTYSVKDNEDQTINAANIAKAAETAHMMWGDDVTMVRPATEVETQNMEAVQRAAFQS